MNQTPLTEFVKVYISETERHDIIASYEQFRTDGFTAEDSAVRNFARKFGTVYAIPVGGQITLWMEMLANECYRYFYHNGV